MFNGWSNVLPRLWHLDQRQATRLDAESLYGASEFAIFYGRTEFTTLADPIETAAIGVRGYLRNEITDLSVTGPFEVSDRHVTLTAPQTTVLAAPVQSVVLNKIIPPVTGVTATYASSGTQVNVGWTAAPSSFVTQYLIRNPAGTTIATVPSTQTTYVDSNAVEMVAGVYSVQATDGVTSAAWVNAPPLTINVQPATATATPAGSTNVTIAWTPNAAQGAADQWRVWNVTLAGWVSALLTGATRSTTVTQQLGSSNTYTVYPYLSGVQGTGRGTSVSNVPAGDPSSLNIYWPGTRYQNAMTWAAPPGVVTDYAVEGYDVATPGWVALGTTAGLGWTWSGMSGRGYMHVRARAPGGTGNWVQAGPVADPSGPSAPSVIPGAMSSGVTWNVIQWSSWEDAQSANAYALLQVSWNGGAWTTIAPLNAGYTANGRPYLAPGSQSAVQYTTPDGNRGMNASFRILTYDVWGNQGVGAASAAVWTKPLGNVTVFATGVDYYTDGVGWRGGWLPYSDSAGSRGVWFYGTAIYDALHGYTPDAAYMELIKQGSNPDEVGYHNLQLVQNASVYDGWTAPILVGGVLQGPYFDTDGQFVEFWTLPFAFYQPMSVGSVRGVALVDSGGPRRLYGINLNSNSGRLVFVYNS